MSRSLVSTVVQYTLVASSTIAPTAPSAASSHDGVAQMGWRGPPPTRIFSRPFWSPK